MEITKKLATSIVIEMKKIIGKNINYIATDGEIIASTDLKRVGTYHHGALEVIRREATLIVESDFEYDGAKEGVNLPVKFDKKVIGVIGISGKKEDVEKYGQIIKKMTEILIREAYLKEEEENAFEYEKILLENILLPEKYNNKILTISKNIKELEIKKDGTVIALEIEDIEFLKKKKIYIEMVRQIIKEENGYLMINGAIIIILFFKKPRIYLEKIINKINKILKEKDNISTIFGIGRTKNDFNLLKESYLEALESLEWSSKNQQDIFFYEDMKIELILNNISENLKNNFVKSVFKNLSPEEIKEYKEIFYTYEKYNGSIDKVSKELFIHKNTLQYKINKIKEKINLDIRNYKDFTILKVAFMCII